MCRCVEITNSKRQIMGKLGHMVQIRDAGSVDYSVNIEVFHLQTIFSARQQ